MKSSRLTSQEELATVIDFQPQFPATGSPSPQQSPPQPGKTPEQTLEKRNSFFARAYNLGKWAIQSTVSLVKRPSQDNSVGTPGTPHRDSTVPTPNDGPTLRERANAKLSELGGTFLTSKRLNVRICTWNVALQPPDKCNLSAWVLGNGSDGSSEMPDVVVVGFQEVELGGTALIMETTDASASWTEALLEVLHRAASDRRVKLHYLKLEHSQLVGTALVFIVRSDHVPFISHTATSVSRTGISGMMGNKGSIGIRSTIYGRRFLFICAHFHPHAYNGKKRCDNYHDALSCMNFSLPASADDELDIATTFAEAQESSSSRATRPKKKAAAGFSAWTRFFAPKAGKVTALDNEQKLLNTHDYVFFFGDLNFRLRNIDSDDIRQYVEEQDFSGLLAHDELIEFQRGGKVFGTFAEAPVTFPPTYKFDMNSNEYDTSAKKRDPAWTDRILYRSLCPDVGAGAGAVSSAMSLGAMQTPLRSREDIHQPTPSRQSGGDSPILQCAWMESSTNSEPATTVSPPSQQAGPVAAVSPASGASKPLITPVLPQVPPIAVRPRSNSMSLSSAPAAVPFGTLVANDIRAYDYTSCQSLMISDHRPVSSSFDVQVMQAARPQLLRAMFELKEGLPEFNVDRGVDELAFV